MLESGIIEHCAPTLAGLKTANMFNYKFSSIDHLFKQLQEENQKINGKGVYIEVLKIKHSRALVYVYRKKMLEADLKREGTVQLLLNHGYEENGEEKCIEQLKKRLAEYDCFPHEIGLFLGYPLEDVIGFMEHGGKNCKCCGLWKVYGDECETRKLFERFKKCTKVYCKVFAEGRNIAQMTVAA